jgi:hypothetical protein
MKKSKSTRLKLAESTSGVGAAVLGVGVGSYFADTLQQLSLPILLLGLLMHGWGMMDKNHIESTTGLRSPWWAAALYWLCLVSLIGLGGLLIFRVV